MHSARHTPCFMGYRFVKTILNRFHLRLPTPSSGGRGGEVQTLIRNKRKQPPCGDWFFRLVRSTEKDITNQVLNNTADRRRFQDCHSRCTERCYFHHYKQK